MSRQHGQEAAVTDSGGEVSMSIEETNRVRISLGMKPLSMGPSTTGPNVRDADAERASVRRTAEADDLRGKIASQREKRQMDAKIRAVKPLGAAAGDEDEEDDIASWAEKSKDKMAARKAEEEQEQRRNKAAEASRKVNNGMMDSDDEDDENGGGGNPQDGASGYSASELAGLRVKHSLSELAAGEGMILTLADKCLLDERGELVEGEDADDELENALVGEERKRKKARDNAAVGKKGKPLWEEDGKVRSMLDKYDEEEEERGVSLGEGGVLEAARLAAQEAMRKKMMHGGGVNAIIDSVAPKKDPLLIKAGPISDYYTAAEAEALSQPLKKKKKKAGRQLRTKEGDGADDAGSTFDLVAALEAEAQAKGDNGDSHLGSRTERMSIKDRQAQVSVVEQADKRARFDAALGKANWASQALRQQPAAAASANDEDDELAASLQKARRQAAASAAALAATAAAATVAAAAAAAKAEAEAGPSTSSDADKDKQSATAMDMSSSNWAVEAVKRAAARNDSSTSAAAASAANDVMLFNDASEFVRTIAVKQETAASASAAAAAAAGASGSSMPGKQAGGKEQKVDMYNDDALEGGAEDGEAMDVEDEGANAEAAAAHPGRWGSWVSAEEAEQSGTNVAKQRNLRKKETEKEAAEREGVAASGSEDVGITGERSIGRGLASVLGLLHDKGVLKQKLEWSGRTNDKKANMVLGLDDVYTGGSHEEHIARAVEAALTTRDQYGRVLTPKERFRELCYKFHGIQPSKNKIDKRIRQDTEEIIVKKAATSERPSDELEAMREMQKNSGSAYIVLSGKGAPTRAAGAPLKRPKNGMDSEGRSTVPPPVPRAKKAGGAGLDGGMTPLEGDRKVEALLGLRKPPPPSNNAGVLSMLPPPPRPPAGSR